MVMNEDPFSRIARHFIDAVDASVKDLDKILQEQLGSWMEDLLKDAFDPRLFLHFIESQGIDMGQASKAMGQQAGFDPYEVLRLDRSATDDQVKKRYRELLHKLHPDTAGVEGTEFLLRVVMAAYEMIKAERGWA